jgi:2-polyprenyl-3-methyl-5-hydroxy-6-metoxy-1,4-benzoquinol methylase
MQVVADLRTHACKLCGLHRHVKLFDEPPVFGETFSLVKCQECGLVSTFPQPSQVFLEQLYSPEHYQDHTVSGAYCSDETLSTADFEHVLGRMSVLAGDKGTLLDVGCGRGLFLGRAAKHGWSVQGIEPSPYAGGIARDTLGDRVRVGYFDASSYPPSTFDAVTLWYVLEHVPDPRAILEQAAKVLKPGGVVFVAVPNWRYIVIRRQLARLKGGTLGPVHAHEHLHQFTSETMRNMFSKVGLDILEERCSTPYMVSGAAINGAKKLAHVGVRTLFRLTGKNMSGILLFGRKRLAS